MYKDLNIEKKIKIMLPANTTIRHKIPCTITIIFYMTKFDIHVKPGLMIIFLCLDYHNMENFLYQPRLLAQAVGTFLYIKNVTRLIKQVAN